MKDTYKIISIYTLLSLLLTYFILGSNNISPVSGEWMLHGDAALDLVEWRYFFSDEWRFPIGLNPNYGLGQGSSIIYSGSIPFLSIFFKLIKFFLPTNFHFVRIMPNMPSLVEEGVSCLVANKKNVKKIKKIFSHKYKPYEIGFISKDKSKIKILGKLQW